MAIAQMNWGRMRYPITDPRMAEFAGSLQSVYRQAEDHSGFIWRIPDDEAEIQIGKLGRDQLISATVSVWKDVASLRDYTFTSLHGSFLERSSDWFQKVNGPQLVIWDVDPNERPTFEDAFSRLETLARMGDTARGYGWPE